MATGDKRSSGDRFNPMLHEPTKRQLALLMILIIVAMLALSIGLATAQPLPSALCQALNAELSHITRFPKSPLTPAQLTQRRNELGPALNRVAWAFRATGIGMSRKDSGNRCPIPGGTTVACDVFMVESGTYWDVLRGSDGGEPYPQLVCGGGPAGTITQENRKRLAPVDPGVVTVPPPTDTDDDGPLIDSLRAQVGQLRVELNAMTAARDAMQKSRDEKYAQLLDWDKQLQAAQITINNLQIKIAGVSCRALFGVPCSLRWPAP